MSDDVNLAKIATALERIATVAERMAPGRVAPAPTPTPQPISVNGEPTPPPPSREFQFSASAGARLREGDKHDPEHKGVKPGRNGGLYCPTKLGDGTWCQWRQAA